MLPMASSSSSTSGLPHTSASAEEAATKDVTSVNETIKTTHRMRITSGGAVSSYVRFALLFLSENPNIPLVLHTLPSDQSQNTTASHAESSKSKSKSTLAQCTLTTSKLISIVEKIKREYVLSQCKGYQRQQSKSKGGTSIDNKKGKGIWQYTETGLYHPPPPPSSSLSALDVSNSLLRVLDGRTKPKMAHHPYLQITLSLFPLALNEKHGVTGQRTPISNAIGKSRSKSRSSTAMAKVNESEARSDPILTPISAQKEQSVSTTIQGEQAMTKGEKRKSSYLSQPQISSPGRADKKRKTGTESSGQLSK